MADIGKTDKGVEEWVETAHPVPAEDDLNEKEHSDLAANLLASGHIQLTAAELRDLEDQLPLMPIDRAAKILDETFKIHEHDPRYDPETLFRIRQFLDEPDVQAHPERHADLVYEMRIFALLTSTSSVYPEVRAVASNTDDPSMPSLTIRVWVIGTILSAIGCVVNAVFSNRYPSISIGQNVIQLVSYPIGVLWARLLPDWKFLGVRLNPGPFNKKEHMLIVIMSGLGISAPPTQHLIFVQAMPQWFNMQYARNPGYQFLGALGTNMIGFGFAGLTRRFLVYPSYCVWPFALSTIALNNALHEQGRVSTPVRGPGKSIWRASMYKCFWVVFGIYFVYYFFPSYIFTNLQIFDWIPWIKPTNGNLVAMTSSNFGVGWGLNPWPTFEYGFLGGTAGYTPMFVPYNFIVGLLVAMVLGTIFWYRNAWNSGYLQINSPTTWDNKAEEYVVLNVVDEWGRLDEDKYQHYSAPYMSAAKLVEYIGMFAYTAGVLTHTLLYNTHELKLGFVGMWRDFKRSWAKLLRREVPADDDAENEKMGDDIHYKLMRTNYPEVPEWWFLIITLVSMALSFICLGVYTNVSPAVVLVAPIITLIFLIPVGVVTAVSGIEPSLNTISELIGGAFAGGDTMTVQFFRMFGSEPVWHALIYAKDLKLSHYVKINPRHMFYVQIWGALLGTVVTVGQWQWLLDMPGICTKDAPFRLICPDGQSNYASFVFSGTIGSPRLFGPGGRFSWLLIGFPIGVFFPILMYFIKKRFPRSKLLQGTHPLLLLLALSWIVGVSLGTYVPIIAIAYFSWNYLKPRYLEFWTRYNYVTLAALSTAISFNALITFFALVFPGVEFPNWWGTDGGTPGCIGDWTNEACAPFKIGERGYFGPELGHLTH